MFTRDHKVWRITSWVLLAALAFVFSSGTGIHSHSIEHAHESLFITDSIADSSHYHSYAPHASTDTSHDIEHGEIASQKDLSPKAVFTKLSDGPSAFLFLVSIWLGLLIQFICSITINRHTGPINLYWRYLLCPPLRAPPQ